MSKEDLDYYNTTSVPFADGSGYAAELGVMHELHCLKKIRHWIWKDYYLDPTTEDMVEYRAHVRKLASGAKLSIFGTSILT